MVYLLRVIISRKYVAITYFMYIYILSSFLQFISPKNKSDITELPTTLKDQGEYKPYQRQLPEYAFWLKYVQAHCICLVLTLFPFLNLPVYAPMLIIYCLILTIVFLR